MENETLNRRRKVAVWITGAVLFILTVLTYYFLSILYENERLPETIILICKAPGEIAGMGGRSVRGGGGFLLLFLLTIASPALIYFGIYYILRDFILQKGPFEKH